ncbi:queuosine precursor transporter [Legionella fairfieldensis]|uniref:queuosine precursor transporter n=1 Tax=Legionella fairfieldensis TaxID=45064 RepID=UPI00048B9023|nr:queuosine precursor transporter [Legionella fairfieldensis]
MENKLTRLYLKKEIVKQEREFKYITFLSMVYVTFLMAATVMAYKIVNIWGFSEPGSTIIYTFTFFLGNIYSELYGAENAKKLIWQSILSGYLFAILITIVNAFPSPEYWDLKEQFELVLGHVLRFTNSGIVGYLTSSFFNVYLIAKWKYQLKGNYFWLRSLIASSLSEGIATFVAGFLTFFGMMPNKSILLIMLNALLFKILYGFFAVWPASFIAYVLKRKEREITEKPSLNPFSLLMS